MRAALWLVQMHPDTGIIMVWAVDTCSVLCYTAAPNLAVTLHAGKVSLQLQDICIVMMLCALHILQRGETTPTLIPLMTCRLAERFMTHDPQRQSPVLSQVVETSEAHLASLPMHARRKLSRLATQVIPGPPALAVIPKLTLQQSTFSVDRNLLRCQLPSSINC